MVTSARDRRGNLCAAVASALCVCGAAEAESRRSEMPQVPRWTVFETRFTSKREYKNPLWEATLTVEFTSPSGKKRAVEGFWDGGRTWRVRFCPDEIGEWSWRSACSVAEDKGLHGRRGGLECVPYEGENPLFQHGPLRLSEDRRSLVHADGTPFFWLSDTAWNGVLHAKAADWRRYLTARRKQWFTAVQFVSTHWRGSTKPGGERAYRGGKRIQLNAGFFRRLDPKVAAINKAGLVAAPVILWALGAKDPGLSLSVENAARLTRHIVARWGAYSVVWILGGDSRYSEERMARWRQIGRAAFGERHDRLVTTHPCGQHWCEPQFRDEPWFDFVGYQSGHGSSEKHLKWLVAGPPATAWQKAPPRPIINLEPNYELHQSYHEKRRFTDREVRRAAYWSLLVSPTAGVSYGNNPIWVWADEARIPEGHRSIGRAEPWTTGLDTPGIRSMYLLRLYFHTLPWWRLRPAPELLVRQPGRADPRKFVAAAKTGDNRHAVLYLPVGGTITVRTGGFDAICMASWRDPRQLQHSIRYQQLSRPTHKFTAPDGQDWVLDIRFLPK